MSRILKVAHITNAFDPAANDAHYTRFRNHDERFGYQLREKAMWEVCLPRRRMPSAALLGLLFAIVLVPTARSEEPRLSISGYDPVAYFTDGKPVPGKTEFEYLWHKLRWQFANSEHRDLFTRDPQQYAPQYDGYCAMGVAWDDPHKDTVDPEAWAIVDGKLYLTHTVRGLDGWREHASENIKTANENWSNVKTLPEPAIVGSPCPGSPPSVVISLSGGGRQVLVGGQTAIDKDGNVVGKGDMSAQIEQVGKNIQACLKAAGASTSAILNTAAYVTDLDAFSKHADIRARYLGPELPTSTTVKVDHLAGPDLLVEIEAVATLN
jgi:enamine deaminase RidA (YjgF/YER057c/UK114 family)